VPEEKKAWRLKSIGMLVPSVTAAKARRRVQYGGTAKTEEAFSLPQ
jgi:hypothetical protein